MGRNKTDDKISEAVLAADSAALKKLVERKKFTNLSAPDGQGRVLIIEACRRGSVACVEVLLAAEPPISLDLVDADGRTALHVASVGGHADCAAQLLQKGAATNIADGQGSAALHLAAVRGHVDVVQKLLAYRAPTGQRDKQNCTAMLLATREGKIPTAELLVSAEANVDAADSHGRTPLMHACRQGAAGLVKALLRRGALVNVRDNEGNTAKEFAVRGSHRECADLLPQNAHMGNLAAAATAPPSGDVSSAALEIELETLKAEITKERETLAAEKAAHAITKADIVQMQAQIAAFAPEDDDDNDVSFDSDDGAVDDGADAAGPALADVAKLRGQLTTLRMENARLKAVGSGATEEVADLPSAQEVTRLKQQVAELEGLLTERDGKGGTASVPISVYQSLKADFAKERKALTAAVAQLEEDKAALSPDGGGLDGVIAASRDRAQHLEAELEAVTAERKTLQKEVESLRVLRRPTKLSQTEDARSDSEKLANMAAQLTSVKKELVSVTVARAELQKQCDELRAMSTSDLSRKDRVDAKIVAERDELHRKLQESVTKQAELQSECNELRATRRPSKIEEQALIDSDKLATMATKLSAMKKERDELQRKVNDSSNTRLAPSAILKKLTALEKKLAAANAENEQLKAGAPAGGKESQLREELEAAQAECDELRAAASAAKDRAGNDARHAHEIACYRHYLLLAVQGKVPDSVLRPLRALVASSS